jgi:hypothetical protein
MRAMQHAMLLMCSTAVCTGKNPKTVDKLPTRPGAAVRRQCRLPGGAAAG